MSATVVTPAAGAPRGAYGRGGPVNLSGFKRGVADGVPDVDVEFPGPGRQAFPDVADQLVLGDRHGRMIGLRVVTVDRGLQQHVPA